jgi:HK97 family phage major capsid protein
MNVNTMTRAQAVARLKEIHEQIERMSGKHRLGKQDEHDFVDLRDEFDTVQAHVEKLDRAADIAACAGEGGGRLRVDRGGVDPYSSERVIAERPAHVDSALRQLDRAVKAGLPARAAEVVEHLTDTGTDLERSWVARWVTDTGSPEYRSAFAKLLMHGESRAGLEFTAAERAAYDRVARLKGEQRAMSLTDSSGGFLVPFELDPTVILANAGSTNPLLQIANVKTVVTDVWHGVSSAGVTAEWLAEAAEASDASPALAEPSIPNYKASAFVPFSVELQGDATALLSEVSRLMSDGLLQLLNVAFTTGTGSGNPTGIVTALTGGSSVVNTGTNDTIAAADIYALQSSLGPRYQANARFVANLGTLNTARQFETTNGALQFPSLQNDPPTLLGRPVHELSNMGGITAGQANPIAIYGDWSNFVITQRVGSSMELIPHLFGANRRPTGQRGAWLWARYGSDSVNDSAFRMLVA